MTERRLTALVLTTLMIVSVFSGTVVISSESVAAAGNTSTTDSRFEVVDVSNAGGNLHVTLEANNSTAVSDFKFWYEDLSGGGVKGPTTLGDGAIAGAYYGTPQNQGATFNPGDSIYEGHPDGDNVTFVFKSGTAYKYVTNPFRVNVTAYDATYSTADTGNRSVATGSYYQISAEDHNGNSLSGVPVMQYNATNNASTGFAFIGKPGTVTYHCLGVEVSGTCTNPDTDEPSSLTTPMAQGGPIPAPLAVETFALSEANASGKVDLSRGATTLTADTPTAPAFIGTQGLTQQESIPKVDSMTIVNESSGNTVWQNTDIRGETGAPVFLRPNTEYTITFTNSSSFGTETRSLAVPTKGMSGARFRLKTSSVDTSKVTGQIVDENGNAVPDAVVVAQPEYASGSQLDVYNSTTADSNGLFTMTLPETDQLSTDYSFRIVGTDTSGGTPVYYPTTDANDGDGYVVQSGQTVLPPMTLQKGGRVDIDVTYGNSQLPVSNAFASLSQVSTAYPSATRTATSNTFSTFSFGQNTPTSAAVSLMSPTTGSETQVTYNVWGLGSGTPQYVCANSPSVSQGSATSSACSLSDAGYLNISVQEYGSIRQQSSSTYADVEDFGFFFENELVIRDASSGNVVTYLGPDGMQQFFAGKDQQSTDISIPLPAGDYTVELRPANDYVEMTTVNDSATVTVSGSSTTDVTLDRGEEFLTRPTSRTDTSLTRNTGNTIAVEVYDPATRSQLTGSDVTVTAQLRYSNGTVASDPVDLGYNSTDDTYDTKSFNPSSLGVDAGSYQIAITTSYTSGTRTYNSTITAPVQVSGFQTAIELGSRTAAPGDTVLGRIHAYDTTLDSDQGIDASSGSVEIVVYDQNGKQVSSTNPAKGVSNGEGTFSLTMPDNPGRYRIATRITSNSGKQGIAERWLRVSQIDLDVRTNRGTYAPTDPVVVTVEATDSTDGSAIKNASITTQFNGNRIINSTGTDGVATIKLDPKSYTTTGQWERGHPISVTVTQETETGVVTKTSGTGFGVQSFDVQATPTARTFTPSESAKLDVIVPTSISISSVSVTRLDGKSVQIGGNAVSTPTEGVRRIDLGQQPVGEHIATVTVNTQSSGSETATTQFVVQQYAVSASLDNRQVGVGETAQVTVSVRQPDGTVVSGQSVSASLNTTNPVRKVDSATATTDSNGDATLSLSSSQSGFHFIEVTVGQQRRYLGLMVSNVDLQLEDGNGNAVSSYTVEPGTTQTLSVNATSGGTPVADDSTVSAFVLTYDQTIELGSAKTTNGEASIDYKIPPSVPAREYDIVVAASTPDGSQGTTTGTLNVTGANAFEIQAQTNESAFTPGETAQLSATVTKGDGSPVANKAVDFVIQSDGTADKRVATVQTNSDGVATYAHSIPSSAGDGQYVLKTALNTSQSIQAFSGYRVRSLDVSVEAEDGPFAPGETVSLTVFANDSTTGDAVTATGGSLRLALPGSSVEKSLSLSGSAPYTVSVTLPQDSSITGTRSISVTVQKDRATDTDSTLVDVRDDSESANFTIARPVTAGQAATVTVNGTVDTTAVLTAFSPGANTVAYNDSVTVSSTSDTTTSMTIGAAGTHVVKLRVPGVGTVRKVISVQSAGGTPAVWTGTSTTQNATNFTKSEDIYIKTNKSGMTATVISQNATYTVQLDSQDGNTYYGVLSEDRAEDIYLVRLDSATSTGVTDTIIEVSG